MRRKAAGGLHLAQHARVGKGDVPFAAAVVDDEAAVRREPERDRVERLVLAIDEDAVARARQAGPRLPRLGDRTWIVEQRQGAIEGGDDRDRRPARARASGAASER